MSGSVLTTQQNQGASSSPGTYNQTDFPSLFRLWLVPKLAEDCGLATHESKKTSFLFRPTNNSQTPQHETPPTAGCVGGARFLYRSLARVPAALRNFTCSMCEIAAQHNLLPAVVRSCSAKRSMPGANFALRGFPSARMLECELMDSLTGRKTIPHNGRKSLAKGIA